MSSGLHKKFNREERKARKDSLIGLLRVLSVLCGEKA
jgi:hypothetical protein